MPPSSTDAVYKGSNEGKKPQTISYSLDRFLSHNGDHDQERPPVAFVQLRDQATAEARETAAMRACLAAFEQQFGSSAK
ncbi:hypothetical protein V8C35DRAFT_309285 [Trichoderma chlorosporum]